MREKMFSFFSKKNQKQLSSTPSTDLPIIVHTNDAFRYHWVVWKLTGIHAPPQVPLLLYRCYAIFLNLFVTILFPLSLFANLYQTHSLHEICEQLTIAVTDAVANIKFINVFFVRDKLLLIQDIVETLDRRARSPSERDVLRQAVRTSQNSFRIFAGIYTVGTTLSLVKVRYAKQRILLYPAYFFIDWQQSNEVYFYVFTYQLFGLIVQAVQDCANDSYPPSYLCVLAGHMKALEIRVRRIGTLQDGRHSLSSAQLEKNYLELVACIEDHLNILKLYGIIQDILSWACMAQVICSALVQCTCALHFLYVVDEKDFSATIISIIFFTAVTLEVFIICYYGHYMREQSEALTQAFYACNWIDQLPKFKRNLVISLMRTQQPCVILAGKYISVDCPTFLQLMKFTYSIFTLLMRFK